MFNLYGRNSMPVFKAVGTMLSTITLVTFVFAGQAMAEIHLMDAWARPTIGNSKNGAAYLKMNNHGNTDDVLLGASADVSKKLELHTHIKDGDVMRMRQVVGGIKVKAGELVELAPGGFHIMMMSMKKKLSVGDSFPLTLVFKRGGEMRVDVHVKKPSMSSGHSQHKKHKH